MKKRFGILFGFFCLAMLDSIFAYAFPVDFTYTHLSVVFHFYLTGLLVFVRDKPWLNRMLIGAMAGLVRDLFITSTFPFCLIMYPLLSLLAGVYQKRIRSLESASVIYLSILFLVDFIPFIYQRATGIVNIGFISWLYHIELLTILVGALIVISLIYADLVMDRFYLFQSRIIKDSQMRKASRRNLPNGNHPSPDASQNL